MLQKATLLSALELPPAEARSAASEMERGQQSDGRTRRSLQFIETPEISPVAPKRVRSVQLSQPAGSQEASSIC